MGLQTELIEREKPTRAMGGTWEISASVLEFGIGDI